MQGIDIKVGLSTSKFLEVSTVPLIRDEKFMKVNIPICLAKVNMLYTPNKNIQNDLMARVLYEMTNEVSVSSTTKIVFIGKNINDIENTALVYYQQDIVSEVSEEFFKRWDETHVMYFEFKVINGMIKKPYFVISAVWNGDHFTKKISAVSYLSIKVTHSEDLNGQVI